MSDPGSLDDELRRMARRSTEDTVSATNVDAELDAVHDRIAGRTAIVTAPRGPDRRLMWLSAAAATVLLAGVVAAVATRGGGGTLQSATEVTPSSPATILATTTTDAPVAAVVSTTSVPPESTTTSLFDTTTTSPVTTLADESAPPPATTTVPIAQTTTTTTPVRECWRELVPPPSLADGSPVGEPVLIDADKGLGTETYQWGDGDFAITQVVGEQPDPSGMPDGFDIDEWGARYGDWRGFSESSADGVVAAWLVSEADGCTVRYGVEPGFQQGEVERITRSWAASLGAGTPIPDGRHPELPAPVPYLGSRGGSDQRLIAYGFEVDGSPTGSLTYVDLADGTVGLGDAGEVRLEEEPSWFECSGSAVVASDDRIADLMRDSIESPFHSVAGSSAGVVVAVRQFCADGQWGDPASYAQVVRYDLADASVEVLKEIRPNDDIIYVGVWSARTMSSDGRYLGASESTSIETRRYHVLDTVDGSPGDPLVLGSSCEDPREIVGVPRFLDGGLVVLARACGGSPILVGDEPTLTVDVVDLETGAVLWGTQVENGISRSYTGTIDGISATMVDGEVWILVTSGGFEDPGRTMLVSEDGQVEVSRLGPFRNYAFTVEDLVIN